MLINIIQLCIKIILLMIRVLYKHSNALDYDKNSFAMHWNCKDLTSIVLQCIAIMSTVVKNHNYCITVMIMKQLSCNVVKNDTLCWITVTTILQYSHFYCFWIVLLSSHDKHLLIKSIVERNHSVALTFLTMRQLSCNDCRVHASHDNLTATYCRIS